MRPSKTSGSVNKEPPRRQTKLKMLRERLSSRKRPSAALSDQQNFIKSMKRISLVLISISILASYLYWLNVRQVQNLRAVIETDHLRAAVKALEERVWDADEEVPLSYLVGVNEELKEKSDILTQCNLMDQSKHDVKAACESVQKSLREYDLPGKVTGAAFLFDMPLLTTHGSEGSCSALVLRGKSNDSYDIAYPGPPTRTPIPGDRLYFIDFDHYCDSDDHYLLLANIGRNIPYWIVHKKPLLERRTSLLIGESLVIDSSVVEGDGSIDLERMFEDLPSPLADEYLSKTPKDPFFMRYSSILADIGAIAVSNTGKFIPPSNIEEILLSAVAAPTNTFSFSGVSFVLVRSSDILLFFSFASVALAFLFAHRMRRIDTSRYVFSEPSLLTDAIGFEKVIEILWRILLVAAPVITSVLTVLERTMYLKRPSYTQIVLSYPLEKTTHVLTTFELITRDSFNVILISVGVVGSFLVLYGQLSKASKSR